MKQKKIQLTKRLSAYAATAGASIALTPALHAQVIYSNPDDIILNFNDPLEAIDIDGDGVDDFGFIMTAALSSYTNSGFNVQRSLSYGALVNLLSASYQNSWLIENRTFSMIVGGSTMTGTTNYLRGLSSSELITNGLGTWSNIELPISSSSLFPGALGVDFNMTSSGPFGSAYGQWGDFINNEKYIGIRFHIGSNLHYGWIRASMADLQPLTIYDWAYESTPNTAILAGEMPTSDEALVLSLSRSGSANNLVSVITITPSEAITGLELSDFNVTNGIVSDLIEVSPGIEYQVTITSEASGSVVVQLPEGAAMDADENQSEMVSIGWELDIDPPLPTLEVPIESPTTQSQVLLIVSFEENTSELLATDLIVSNGTAIANPDDPGKDTSDKFHIWGGSRFEFLITAVSDGEVHVEIPADVVTDDAGNGNAASSINWVFDASPPQAIFSAIPSQVTEITQSIILSFDEELQTDLVEGNLNVTNGTLNNFYVVSNQEYTFEITAFAEGEVTVTLEPSVAIDHLGNENAGASLTWEYINIPTINMELVNYNLNRAYQTVEIHFSDDVSGLEIADFVVSNGVASNLQTIQADSVYSLDVEANANGAVSLLLPADAIEEGNLADSISWDYQQLQVNVLHDLSHTVQIYPNPTQNTLTVNTGGIVEMCLYDMNGRIVYQRNAVMNEEIDVSSLKPGSYILQLTAEGHMEQHKVVIE